MGPTHRIWGAHQGAVAGAAIGSLWGPGQAVSATLLWAGTGYAFATLPDRVERPLGLSHRGPSHWPEFPLFGGLLALAVAALDFGPIAWIAAMVFAGICNSILSHWTGDFMFGKAHTRDNPDGSFTVIRPRGVPYFFGTRYKGIGFKVNSGGERRFRAFLKVSLPLTIIASMYLAIGA
jgi:hypothetical protein